jgi:hypothetical protein
MLAIRPAALADAKVLTDSIRPTHTDAVTAS